MNTDFIDFEKLRIVTVV